QRRRMVGGPMRPAASTRRSRHPLGRYAEGAKNSDTHLTLVGWAPLEPLRSGGSMAHPAITNNPPERASVGISGTDADDLRWYFRDGLRRLEQPSNMQVQLDRLSLYYHRAKPCTACGGDIQRNTAGC